MSSIAMIKVYMFEKKDRFPVKQEIDKLAYYFSDAEKYLVDPEDPDYPELRYWLMFIGIGPLERDPFDFDGTESEQQEERTRYEVLDLLEKLRKESKHVIPSIYYKDGHGSIEIPGW